MLIRDATPNELPEVGELRVSAYQAGGFLSKDSEYAQYLRVLGAGDGGHVLVAVDPAYGSHQPACQIAGTVALQLWPNAGQVVTGPGEAEIRALAVAPHSQRAGVGRALLGAVIERAAELAVDHLVLLTQPDMRAARHLYEQARFVRLPDRDWSPAPGTTLLAYGLRLAAAPPLA